MTTSRTIDTLIVGAGLTGLSVARALAAQGCAVLIAEARDRIGGRAWSPLIKGERYDLGPAWFWPGQPLMADLASDLRLTVFEQFSDGNLVFEDSGGALRRDLAMAPMAGSLRIDGGMGALADGLAAPIADHISLAYRLTRLSLTESGVSAQFDTPSGAATITAGRVILAMPPRLIASRIATKPDAGLAPLARTPTWMAGQAKLIALYRTPFWRDAGLSGDAISHRGPLAEIHDASPMNASAGALFGFVSTPPGHRADQDVLKSEAIDQLTRLFGDGAAHPAEVVLMDWTADDATATPEDHAPLTSHPAYAPLPQPSGPWRDRLFITASETAPLHGGYLEGALEAAAATVAALTRALPPR